MKYILSLFFKHYFNFKGLANRKDFNLYILCYLIIIPLLIIVFISVLFKSSSYIAIYLFILLLMYGIIIFIPTLAILIRRIRDLQIKFWFLLFLFIPIVCFGFISNKILVYIFSISILYFLSVLIIKKGTYKEKAKLII